MNVSTTAVQSFYLSAYKVDVSRLVNVFLDFLFGGRGRGREEDVPPSPLSPPTRSHTDVLSEQTPLVFILPPIFAHNATSRKRPILTVFIGWVLLGGPPPPTRG